MMISATIKHVAPMGCIDIAPLVLVLVLVLVPVGSTTTVLEEGVPDGVITAGEGVDGVGVGDELDTGVDVALD
jgi:hypothetical protein